MTSTKPERDMGQTDQAAGVLADLEAGASHSITLMGAKAE